MVVLAMVLKTVQSHSPGHEPANEGGEKEQTSGSPLPQASSATPQKPRAKKTSYSLDAEVEKALVEWIKENDILWNSKLIRYKRIDLKEALWNEKAKELEKTATYLKGWWRSIKDIFTRLHKRKSGDGPKDLTEREEWIFATCTFLGPLVRHVSQPMRSVSMEGPCVFVS
ncbi:uncharacterized protein [Branchiostoma lanceolatum]|uniref:uncharacterized protein n=1 Tax=Branchiostoma lanceolatum TaxID=7740 RepID=UPI00345671F1